MIEMLKCLPRLNNKSKFVLNDGSNFAPMVSSSIMRHCFGFLDSLDAFWKSNILFTFALEKSSWTLLFGRQSKSLDKWAVDENKTI